MENGKITKEMKYIKWPRKGKVFGELMSVIAGAAVMSMLLAASDELSKVLFSLFM